MLSQSGSKRVNNNEQPSPEPQSPGKAGEWVRHEHVASPVQVEAEKLLATAGSAELAKQAIDEAEQRPISSQQQQADFAAQWGHQSIHQMLAVSSRLTAPDGTPWWATNIQDEGWILWNERDLRARQRFPSLEACHRYLAAEPK
jgi:hypothetical protein